MRLRPAEGDSRGPRLHPVLHRPGRCVRGAVVPRYRAAAVIAPLPPGVTMLDVSTGRHTVVLTAMYRSPVMCHFCGIMWGEAGLAGGCPDCGMISYRSWRRLDCL